MGLPARRDDALAMDAADELGAIRAEFLLPPDVVYLDGNSLGPLPRATAERIEELLHREWGAHLVQGWSLHGWIELPLRVGDAIAPLIGAEPGEVVVADSTSVNLFKLLAAALRLRPGRSVILTDRANFPTDLYVAQGLTDLLAGRCELCLVERAEIGAALDERVAALMLTHVDFRSGEMLDLAGLTSTAHGAGALALWDLSHTAGVIPVDLGRSGVDLAVGCGYKYLNGGPGAPAYAYVARRLHDAFRSPLWGWMGHAAPFEFAAAYRPAEGLGSLLCGTPPILSLAALAGGVEVVARAGIERLRRKSIALTETFVGLVERECAGCGLELASPSDPGRRGSQVSYRHPEGYAVMQALIRDGVIGDFRAPDLLRFGFSPACVRFVDAWDAVVRLRRILEEGSWNRPEFKARGKVT